MSFAVQTLTHVKARIGRCVHLLLKLPFHLEGVSAMLCTSSHRRDLLGTPTKRQVSKRQVSKRPVSKRLKRQVYKTSTLQNIRFTKCQDYKTSGLQNVRLQKSIHIYSVSCCWWKSAGSVAAMFAGKVMAVFYSLF